MGRMKNQMIKMAQRNSIAMAIAKAEFLKYPGAHVVVDGQFGSTGKGLFSGLLAELFLGEVDYVTTNAGPNSGHTSYYEGTRVVLRQLPTFGVIAHLVERNPKEGRHYRKLPEIVLNAGAIIDLAVLHKEVQEYDIPVTIDPAAAVVTDEAVLDEKSLVSAIGSTGKGTGAALAAKIMRKPGAVALDHEDTIDKMGRVTIAHDRMSDIDLYANALSSSFKILVEVSQGYSLGINEGMYPYTTSRQCTVAQAISDAGLHPSQFRTSAMVVRTFPIRVAGNSGPCYPDQREVTWEELGQTPELTTVTQKVRRVFTWSRQQFCDALAVNRPSVVFLNFCNYLENDPDELTVLIQSIQEDYRRVMGKDLKCLLGGFGPYSDDVVVLA